MTARPAFELADVFRRHGETYERANAGHLGRVERRAIGAITACRTASLGGHVERCDDCGLTHIAYNSCRNRNCGKCQGGARAEWLAARQAELLPVPYFHVVFTLPPAAAEIAFQNKQTVYGLLMRAAAQALMTLAAERLGARIGLIAVLHTWGQALTHLEVGNRQRRDFADVAPLAALVARWLDQRIKYPIAAMHCRERRRRGAD